MNRIILNDPLVEPEQPPTIIMPRIKSFKYEFSDHQGSVQRLPNGNTLIVNGYSKKINELDDNGKIVWSLETSNRISRAYRYGLKYQGVLSRN